MSFRYASLHEFLLDQNLSPALAALLAEAGHDTVHVRDLNLSRASDERVMSRAVADDRVLVSSDTDFGELLARTNAGAPSLLLLRRQSGRRAAQIAGLIAANLDSISDDPADTRNPSTATVSGPW